MTVQELKQSGNIIFETISGSHAYGTNVEGSDIDIRGVYTQPLDEILRGDYIPQISDETNDITYYEVQRFLELLMDGNPNMIELLNIESRFIRIKTEEFDYILQHKNEFLTEKLIETFGGYAQTQIKKSKGLGKKIFNPQPKNRKDILEFCYIIDGSKSIPFWEWVEYEYSSWFTNYSKENVFNSLISKWGLSKVQNGNQLYVIYEDDGDLNFRGIIKDLSVSDLRLSSIPKHLEESDDPHIMWFNLDGFKKHCKDHKQYWEWVEKRNKVRYDDNIQGETGYDKKNMLHVLRLLYTLKDVVTKNKVITYRPEREYLISIRKGSIPFSEIMEKSDTLLKEIKTYNHNLKKEVDKEKIKDLLLKIRKCTK